MKRIVLLTILSICLMGLMAPIAHARPTMAFGYLANNSNDDNFDYLETIFPNSFANSLKNIFDINAIKPHSLNEELKKYKQELKKYYQAYELPELVEKIDSDLFIYGNFTPLPNNQIKIVLHLYAEDSKRIFTFTNVGKMETEIFRLVDRITMILLNFMDKDNLFITKIIAPSARLAFFTNLEGDELNQFYFPFMQTGYGVSYFQGNELYNKLTVDDMQAFSNVATRENSYDIITDMRKVRFLYGTWSGNYHDERTRELRESFTANDLNYLKSKEAILETINKTYNGSIDYLIIAGFDTSRSRAWVRCIDLKEKDLVWMQTDIKGGSIKEIGENMIKRMNTKIEDPFKEQIEKNK